VPSAPGTAATVVWIVDGDTLDVTLTGTRTRVRLINIDAPELGHDGAASQCLADEAERALAGLAPPGATVTLASYGNDRYGRLLAGAHLADGRLVNAEVVRLGLAGPLVVDGQKPLLDAVAAARDEAARAGAGLHGAASCSVPGRLSAARTRLDAVPPNPTRAEAQGLIPSAEAAAAEASAVAAQLHADVRDALVQGLTADEYGRADAAASRLRTDADATLARLRTAAG